MKFHRLKDREAVRPTVAALVLAVTFSLCLWLGQYEEWVPNTGVRGTGSEPFTPHWAIPLAIIAGLGGATLAVLIVRPHRANR
jgi:hypothetical protein